MILKAENIQKSYKRSGNNICVISDVSITVRPAEYHCIFGTSGSGKSTLLNILSGMLTPTKGNVYFNNEDLYSKREIEITKMRIRKVGYIMQGASLLNNLSVYDNIIFPLEIAKQQVDYELVDDIINKLELTKLLNAYPKELSGGEYRRVAVARTIISSPQIIIADEPTSNLDEKNADIIRSIFEKLYLSGTAIIVATHDMKFNSDHHIIHNIECGKLFSEQNINYK